jgi:hypothetical protein
MRKRLSDEAIGGWVDDELGLVLSPPSRDRSRVDPAADNERQRPGSGAPRGLGTIAESLARVLGGRRLGTAAEVDRSGVPLRITEKH